MIHADFTGGSAAISGAYQYDTGQRLRLSGLPSPEEMTDADDLLNADQVAVQVQFAYEGDSQAETRLAVWDDWRGVWVCDIPDEYLTRHAAVRVYVYVYYGSDDNGARAETAYEGVFTPRSRPAPSTTVTDEQLEAWAAMREEIEVVLSSAGAAKANAQTAATGAETSAQEAHEAADDADGAADDAQAAYTRLKTTAEAFAGMPVYARTLAAGAAATAGVEGGAIVLGIPKGAKGDPGDPGAKGPADITLSFASGVLTITPT